MKGTLFRVCWYRFRTTFRHRWGDYLTLVLLIGLVGGIAMGAVAAARRTQSSFPAFLASSNPSDLVDTTAMLNPVSGVPNYDPAPVRTLTRLPHVRRVETYVGFNNVLTLGPSGAPGGIGSHGGPQALLIGSVDGEYFTQDRVAVIAGRMADPKRADEVVMSASAAKEFRLHVGSVGRLGFYTNAQANDPAFGTARMEPYRRIDVKLVGIVASNDSVVQDDTDGSTTFILFTPTLTRPLTLCCAGYAVSGLQLDGGSGAVSTVEGEIVRALPNIPPHFYVTAITEAKAERAVKPESIALGVFGGIAALAALLIASQVIARQLHAGADQARTVRALGASPAMTTSDALMGIVGFLVAGSLLAIAVAVGLSPLAPVGAARPVYPTPGVDFDWTVLGLGLMVLVGGLGVVTLVLAYRQTPHRLARRQKREVAAGSGVARAAGASGLPAPAVAGIGFALEPGGGAGAVPMRSAVLGAVLAMTVVITTVIFGASLDTLVSRPALYGWNWDYALNSYFGGSAGIPSKRAATLLDNDRYVAGWTGVFYGTAQIDRQTVPVLGARPNAPVAPPVLSGKGLEAPDQIVLGATTLAELHRAVGDWVDVNLAGAPSARLQIVGTTTLPTIGSSGGLHTTMGTGALLPTRYVQLQAGNGDAPNVIFVRFHAGANPTAALRSLQRLAANLNSQTNGPVSVLAVQRPAEIVNYRSMGATPAYLGAGLAGGAVVALGLTLVATVRRRRRELALLKTLGFTQRQLAATVAWQSSVAVAIGTVVGVPVGIVLGRFLWDVFAHEIHVVPTPSIPGLSISFIALGALALANIVAAVPGRIAARTPTALLLRAE